jgi:hypothetical protein
MKVRDLMSLIPCRSTPPTHVNRNMVVRNIHRPTDQIITSDPGCVTPTLAYGKMKVNLMCTLEGLHSFHALFSLTN